MCFKISSVLANLARFGEFPSSAPEQWKEEFFIIVGVIFHEAP